MCGIVGISSSKSDVNANKVQAGIAAIRHRGPDGNGVWIHHEQKAGLGHARLSIVDIAGGAQPLFEATSGKIVLVVNGELYGTEELREKYKQRGYKFHTGSDSEIIIPLYKEYGINLFAFLRGEFSFLLWDGYRNVMIAARDRFGVKPLFYSRQGSKIYFGSEIKSLLAMGVPSRWNYAGVMQSEYSGLPNTETMFDGVHAVPPGHYVETSAYSTKIVSYWKQRFPRIEKYHEKLDEKEWIGEFYRLFDDAIRLRMRADVPIAYYLSGGIDSSSVLSLGSRYGNEKMPATFSITFPESRLYDESVYSREMADYAGAQHFEVPVSSTMIADSFADSVWHNESPLDNCGPVALYLLSKKVRDEGFKVVMTGQGSDEVLAGYPFYMLDLFEHDSNVNNEETMKMLAASPTGKRFFETGSDENETKKLSDLVGFAPSAMRGAIRNACYFSMLHKKEFQGYKAEEFKFEKVLANADLSDLAGTHCLSKSLYFRSVMELHNLILTAYGDRMEMANSIEGRVPFLDDRLVEFLLKVPPGLKIKGTTEKYLLKEAMKNDLPESIYKRKKHPFLSPTSWVEEDDDFYIYFMDEMHSESMKNVPFYDREKTLDFVKSIRKGNKEDIDIKETSLMFLLSMSVMQKQFKISA